MPEKKKRSLAGNIVVDFSNIPEDEFDPTKPLRIAAIRDNEIIDEKVVTPSKTKKPRQLSVSLDLGETVDGVAGANIVVAPADDERNLFSNFVAKKFVSGREARIDGGVLQVSPNIYKWWRFCWFPRQYRISGRVVRQEGECTHPVGAANVEIYDVDYCWWWYDEDLIRSVTTDADGFFDVTFTWCVPLWCLFRRRRPPLYVDTDLRDRIWDIIRKRIPYPVPPFPPDDPWQFERLIDGLPVELPEPELEVTLPTRMQFSRNLNLASAETIAQPFDRLIDNVAPIEADFLSFDRAVEFVGPSLNIRDILDDYIIWPICEDPCDWRPDIRIRVTQEQPGTGTVEIFREKFSDIHWNLNSDLLNLTLEVNEDALYADVCRPDPLLGNCMLFERVGNFNISTLYQTDLPGPSPASYGTTPDRIARLGRTVSQDRAWCLTPSVYGDFGKAAQVDYYQVQFVQWNAADRLAWQANNQYVPDNSRFSNVSQDKLVGFTRKYAELQTVGSWSFYKWQSEGFGPQTIGGISGLYKSRQRFEQEYENSHSGNVPAPDFVTGWYWGYLNHDSLVQHRHHQAQRRSLYLPASWLSANRC